MFTFTRILPLISSFVLTIVVCAGQQKNDVVMNALRDEMDRSMKELRVPELDAPFFMMYGIDDKKTYSISASLGSIVHSYAIPQRFKTNTRILVGDYSFNDESLDDNLFSNPTALEIAVPLDDDYLGIRRALWSTTDNVYRSAARHFEKHKQTLKESGKTLESIPHRNFGKSDPVRLHLELTPYAFDQGAWETKLRKLSGLFVDQPSIENSTVVLTFVETTRYLVSSEGTEARLPRRLAVLTVLAQARNENGEFSLKRILHVAETPDELPSEQVCADEINKIIRDASEDFNLPAIEEEYSGPVLYLGKSVAEFVSTCLFFNRENIMANDNIPRQSGYQYNQMSSMDNKIGKLLINEHLTVKAKPSLKLFRGTKLLGSFSMDNEGIVPSEEVVIFDKGVLKELLNNRTITHKSQKANGFASGPGVIEVTSAQPLQSTQLLKEKLIAEAKKQGLEYAIIVREESAMGMLSVYAVSVADGTEKKFRNAMALPEGLKSMKNILATGGDMQAVNFNFEQGGFNGQEVVSFIVPSGILVDDITVKALPMPTLKEEQYVSRPK